MGLKIETITNLLHIIDQINMCHFEIAKQSGVPDEVVQRYLDMYTSELHEVIKADAIEQAEDWKLKNSTAEYIEELEQKLFKLEEEGCVHPHHEQEYQSSLQAERDFYGLDD